METLADFRALGKVGAYGTGCLIPLIEDAFLQAWVSGLKDVLIQWYWGDAFATLHFDERVKIQLVTPG